MSLIVAATASLTSCGEVAEAARNYFGACSTYNDERDGFSMTIPDEIVVPNGTTGEINMSASWLNEDLRRVSLDCSPTWTVSNPAVVKIEGRKLTAIAPGIARVTATVTGSETVTETMWVMVTPPATEQEPNNGTGFAKVLVSQQTDIGFISTSDDIDVYAADIPAGRSYQFTLKSAPAMISGAPFYVPSFYGSIRNATGAYIGDDNRGYTNTSGQTQRVYFTVNGSSSTKYPYSVTLELR